MATAPAMIPASPTALPIRSAVEQPGKVENATTALSTVSIQTAPVITEATKPVRGSSVRLSVPLDSIEAKSSSYTSGQTTTVHGTRKLLRRDSLDRREALLKGKEGSRQRRRWENDRLLNNPHAEPPLPSDWEVRPTYPRRTIPYYLAPLWDAAEFQRAIESKLKGSRRGSVRHGRNQRSKKPGVTSTVYDAGMSPMEEAASNIPKEIRSRLKHARSAKGLLQDLEEEVRDFVQRWNDRELRLRRDGLSDAPLPKSTATTAKNSSAIMSDGEIDEEDEEIVFVGRNGAMHDLPSSSSPLSSPTKGEQKGTAGAKDGDEDMSGMLATEKLVFQAADSDKGAGFARWLVHCVGNYYGLRTWSVTADVDGEPKRQAFVGVDSRVRGFRGKCIDVGNGSEVELPRPLWGMV